MDACDIVRPRARRLTCTIEEYHRDPCPRPSLSSSIATTLVTRSPLHAHAQHPRLGGLERETTEEMNFGTVVHALVLGKGAAIEEMPFDDYKTNRAKEARDNAIACGHLPVKSKHLERARTATTEITRQLALRGIVFGGESEVAIEWEEESPIGPVLCRSMLDHVLLEDALVVDLKTSGNAHPEAFAKSAINFGYDIQSVVYPAALEALHPQLAGRVDFVFAVVEPVPPYAVLVARPTGNMRELGTRRWLRAVESWAECTAAQKWPGYGDGIGFVDVPVWAIRNEEGME